MYLYIEIIARLYKEVTIYFEWLMISCLNTIAALNAQGVVLIWKKKIFKNKLPKRMYITYCFITLSFRYLMPSRVLIFIGNIPTCIQVNVVRLSTYLKNAWKDFNEMLPALRGDAINFSGLGCKRSRSQVKFKPLAQYNVNR